MNIATLAKMIGVSPDTLRRWTADYEAFLTPTANPGSGKTRVLSAHDMAVLNYVATARNTGMDRHTIVDRLEEMQAEEWRSLPAIPSEWTAETETVPLDLAASRASEMAQVAVLQSELQHVRMALEAAQNRVEALEAELSEMDTVKGQNHALQLDLERARGEVAQLQAQLSAYAITGGGKPIPVALIVAVTAVAAVLVVLVVLIVARLVL